MIELDALSNLIDGIGSFTTGAYKASGNDAFNVIHENLMTLGRMVLTIQEELTNDNPINGKAQENT